MSRPSLFVVESIVDLAGEPVQALTCFYRAPSGRFGFAFDETLWREILDHPWIFDRREGRLVEPDPAADILPKLKDNMRPFATALFPSNPASAEWLRQISRAQVRRRIEETKRRLRRESGDPLDVNVAEEEVVTRSLAAPSLDIHALGECAAAVRTLQVWAFSDRGQYCISLSKDGTEAQRALEEASKKANVDLVRVAKTADVPTW